MLFSSLSEQALLESARAVFRRWINGVSPLPPDPSPPRYYDVPYHMTTRPESPTPSPLFLCTYTVPRLHTLYPHPPISLRVWGEGGWIATRSTQDCLNYVNGGEQSPTTLNGPGILSMKVEYLQGAPPSVEPFTHTKLHMQVLGTIHGGGRICRYNCCCSLSWTPTAMVWAAFSCRGAKG